LQVQLLAHYDNEHNAKREPAQKENCQQAGRNLQTFRLTVSCKIKIATVNPLTLPHYAINAECNNGQQNINNQSACFLSVLTAGYVCFFCEGMNQIPLIKAKSYD
jgi:hypothetical protein